MAAEAALTQIENLADEEWVYKDTAERMRGLYGYRRRRFAARHNGDHATDPDLELDGNGDEEEDYELRSAAFQRLRRELLGAEREAVLRLRSEGKIGDGVMRRSSATSTSKKRGSRMRAAPGIRSLPFPRPGHRADSKVCKYKPLGRSWCYVNLRRSSYIGEGFKG